ncbi:MAG: hypothetical protein KAS38_00310 [Anaerolineales bacterium]|nr:hypothetical protein [Anaerolineales bacterium]
MGLGSGVLVEVGTKVGLGSGGSSVTDSEDVSCVDVASTSTGDEISVPGVPHANRTSDIRIVMNRYNKFFLDMIALTSFVKSTN